jgi:hypothetical protein
VLRSSERIAIDEVLQFTRFDDLIAYIADRKITELSYGGLKELERFLAERLGLALFASSRERMLLTIFVELRNIETHNRGIINELFLKRVGSTKNDKWKFVEGKVYHALYDEFVELANNSIEVSVRLDSAIAKKFKLKRSKFYKRHVEAKHKRIAAIAGQPLPASTVDQEDA